MSELIFKGVNGGRVRPKRWRTASKKERVLLGRLDKLIGVPTGFHLCIYETSTREAGNAIMEKARKECKKL